MREEFAESGALVLAIETCVEMGSVALVSPEKVVKELVFEAGRTPSAALWEPLDALMANVEVLAGVVVGTGPGSYNGARVGIAAGQGIALVKDCPLVGLCSFEAVGVRDGFAVGDARRGGFSMLQLTNSRVLAGACLLGAAEFEHALEKAIIEGATIMTFEEIERFPVSDLLKARIVRKRPEAGMLGGAYWQRSKAERDALANEPTQPFYLREAHITKAKGKPLF